jgi:hypothetical protein
MHNFYTIKTVFWTVAIIKEFYSWLRTQLAPLLTVELYRLARFLEELGVAKCSVPTTAAAAAMGSPEAGTKSWCTSSQSLQLPSLSLVSPEEARFTRHGLLFGWLFKLQ